MEVIVMKSNIGKTDSQIRITLGLYVVLIGILLDAWWSWLGLIPIWTVAAGWCPLYSLQGIRRTRINHGAV